MHDLEAALLTTLDFSRESDPVDHQFHTIWPSIRSSAQHAHLLTGRKVESTPAITKVAATLFMAWHRAVYFCSDGYGGAIIVYPCPHTLYWLRRYMAALLALRGIDPAELRAENACTALRSSKESVQRARCAMFYGLPFPNLMSWDVTLMLSVAEPDECLFFGISHPSQWTVKPMQSGEVVRLESRVSQVLDVKATFTKVLRARNNG